MRRVTTAQPEWTMQFIDGLQSEVAAIDQASTQWTLALLFDLVIDHLSIGQRSRAIEIMKHNLSQSSDWIVLNNSMKVLGTWAGNDHGLQEWLRPRARHLVDDGRKSVAANARKLLDLIGWTDVPSLSGHDPAMVTTVGD